MNTGAERLFRGAKRLFRENKLAEADLNPKIGGDKLVDDFMDKCGYTEAEAIACASAVRDEDHNSLWRSL